MPDDFGDLLAEVFCLNGKLEYGVQKKDNCQIYYQITASRNANLGGDNRRDIREDNDNASADPGQSPDNQFKNCNLLFKEF